jgi:hypothetical protein
LVGVSPGCGGALRLQGVRGQSRDHHEGSRGSVEARDTGD